MGNNVFTHGFWQQERIFTLDPMPLPKPGVAPVKDCTVVAKQLPPEYTGPKEGCGALIHAAASVCPYCSALQPVTKKREKIGGKFVELDPSVLERDLSTLTFTELELYRNLRKGADGNP